MFPAIYGEAALTSGARSSEPLRKGQQIVADEVENCLLVFAREIADQILEFSESSCPDPMRISRSGCSTTT